MAGVLHSKLLVIHLDKIVLFIRLQIHLVIFTHYNYSYCNKVISSLYNITIFELSHGKAIFCSHGGSKRGVFGVLKKLLIGAQGT